MRSSQGTGTFKRQVDQSAGIAGLAVPMSPCIITSRMVAPCDHCGRPAAPVHMPRQEHGLYCPECCPACSRQRNAAEPERPAKR